MFSVVVTSVCVGVVYMVAKPQLLMLIVCYLFIASLLFSFTYATQAWNVDIDVEVPTYDVNFTSDVNLTALNIVVVSGLWVVENGNLTAKSANNMFVIPGEYDFWDPDEGSVVTYKLYDLNSVTRLICYYDEGLLWNRMSYIELDIFEEVLNVVYVADSWFDYLDVYDVHWSGSYGFDSSVYEISIEIIQPGFNDPYVNVTINDELVCDILVPVTRGFSSQRHQSGVYAENSGLKVNYVSEFEVVDEENDSGSVLDGLSLVMSILLFVPPNVIMPFWLNFLAFKLPLMGVMIIGYELVRGI